MTAVVPVHGDLVSSECHAFGAEAVALAADSGYGL